MSLPLVSVCIPVYNGAPHLGETIRSVLSQSLGDFELIILDDGSADNSWDIANAFSDQRIRAYRNPRNMGAQGNWNKAVDLAAGRYFKLLCHDDILLPLCLEKQVEALEDSRNTTAGLACCGRIIANSEGRRLISRRFGKRGGLITGRDAIVRTLRSGANLLGEPTAVLIRSEYIKKTEGFNASHPYVIDLRMWCDLLQEHDLFFLNEDLVVFRATRASWSFRLVTKQATDFTGFMKDFIKETNVALPHDVLFRGTLAAHLNAVLRRLFYKVFLSG